MRLEINAFFMHTDGTDSFIRSFGDLTDQADFVTSSFESIRNDLCDISGGVGCLQSALDDLEARIKEEETVHENLEDLKNQVEDYIDEVLDTDSNVAKIIHKEKDKFYEVNPWAAPPEEDDRNIIERIWDACVDVVEEVIDIAEDIFDRFVDNIRDVGEAIFDFCRNGLENLRDFGHWVLESIEAGFDIIRDFIEEHGRAIIEILIGVELILVAALITVCTDGAALPLLIGTVGFAFADGLTSGYLTWQQGGSLGDIFDSFGKGFMSGSISGFATVGLAVLTEGGSLAFPWNGVIAASTAGISELIHASLDFEGISSEEWGDIISSTIISGGVGFLDFGIGNNFGIVEGLEEGVKQVVKVGFGEIVEEGLGNLISETVGWAIENPESAIKEVIQVIMPPLNPISPLVPSLDFDVDLGFDLDMHGDSSGFDLNFDFNFDMDVTFDFRPLGFEIPPFQLPDLSGFDISGLGGPVIEPVRPYIEEGIDTVLEWIRDH